MTDSMSPSTRRCFPRTSKSRNSKLNIHPNSSGNHPASDPTKLGESPAQGLAQMRYPRTRIRELRVIPATMIAQWKEMFKTLSRVKCPSSDCWCEFPSVFSLKQHYERCQGVGLAFRLRFSCPSCEAVFVAKAQLQKHLVWNHSDRGGTQEQRSKQSAFDSGGKERCNGIPLKSTTLYKPKRGSARWNEGEC